MTFLPQYTQLMLLNLERNELQNKELTIQRRAMQYSKDAEFVEDFYSAQGIMDSTNYSVEDQDYYKHLKRLSDQAETMKESYDTQISALDDMINSLQQQVKTGVQNDCSLILTGGK